MRSIIIVLLLSLIKNVCMQACSNGGQLLANYISPEEKEDIVNLHNLYRSCIALGPNSESCEKVGATDERQPQAANMPELKWDDYLANQAQIWADNCIYDHHKIQDSRFSVGQNLGIQRTSGTFPNYSPNFDSVIKNWFDEEKNYVYHPLTPEDIHDRREDDQIGHYVQVVAARTYLIGCGFAYFKDTSGVDTKLYVCNYGPNGNIYTTYPYEKGQPDCQAYNLGQGSVPGLCSKG